MVDIALQDYDQEWPGIIVGLAPPFDYVEIGGWTPLAPVDGGTQYILYQRARNSGYVWVRSERLTASSYDNSRSGRSMYQTDCSQWKVKVEDHTTFSGPNLSGQQRVQATGHWLHVAPDTAIEKIMIKICME